MAQRRIPVTFHGGPLDGKTLVLDERTAVSGYRHPIEQPPSFRPDAVGQLAGDLLIAEYRPVNRQVRTDTRFGPHDIEQILQVDMRMVKPPQVRAVEKLLNEWRVLYGMGTVGFGDS
jgi:hypothetical protein